MTTGMNPRSRHARERTSPRRLVSRGGIQIFCNQRDESIPPYQRGRRGSPGGCPPQICLTSQHNPLKATRPPSFRLPSPFSKGGMLHKAIREFPGKLGPCCERCEGELKIGLNPLPGGARAVRPWGGLYVETKDPPRLPERLRSLRQPPMEGIFLGRLSLRKHL